jgi:mRNA-degrading endonuclease RelE of RelBE toxin-antitoxin system
MPTTVNIPPEVQKEIKKLRRKYPSVTSEVRKLVVQLEEDERPGDKIASVGYDVYKVRLPNPSAKRGKSGGFRVIYYVKLAESVILITIYSKTQQSNISPEAIRQALEEIETANDDNEEDDNL